MSGHRRISTALFLEERRKARESGAETTRIEALLELDLDSTRGTWPATGPPVKTYARLWGWTPGRARRLIETWKAHAEDLYNARETPKNADPLRTPGVPLANPQANPQNVEPARTSEGVADPPANPPRTPGGPFADPILEPNRPEPSSHTRKRRGTLCPERFTDDQVARIRKWAAKRHPSLDSAALQHAFERVRDWSHGGDHFRSDWVATFRNGVTAGWALKGLEGATRSAAVDRDERTKTAVRRAVAARTAADLRIVGGGNGAG